MNSITKADLIFVNGNSIIVGSSNFIWYSGNNEDSWGLAYQYALSGIYGMAANENIILAARSALKSTDNGMTWITSSLPGLTYALSSFNNLFYAGTTSGIYKSSDYGDSWISASAGLGNGTIKVLINDGNNFYAAGENISAGVYKSTDEGTSWHASGTGFDPALTIRSMLSKGEFIFAAAEDDGIYRSSDDGDSWFKAGTSGDSLSNAIVFSMKEKNNVVVAGSNKGMFRSTNNGDTWSRITSGFPPGASTIFVFSLTLSGNNIVAAVRTDVSLQSGIYYSTNDGLSWTLSNLSFGIVEAVASNGGLTCLTVVATVGTLNGLYRSTDGGITWVQNIFYFNNPDVQEIAGLGDIWMMSTLFTTFRSSNSGYGWTSSPVPGGSIFTYTKVGDNNIFGGNNQGIFRSQNWGVSWENVNNGLPENIDVEASCANQRFLLAGTSDHSVWKRELSDFGITGVNGNVLSITSEYKLNQNFPNPFNPETNISYHIPSNPPDCRAGVKGQTSIVKLLIYNSLGKEVATLVNENQSAGSYSVDWNASNYSSGIYFYKLIAGEFSEVKKMTLLK